MVLSRRKGGRGQELERAEFKVGQIGIACDRTTIRECC